MLKEVHILSPYDFQWKLICCLVLQAHGGMQVFAKLPIGLTVTLDMDASDAMHYVKTSCWSPDALCHTFSSQKNVTHYFVLRLRNGWQVFVKPLTYMTTTPDMEASDETISRGGQCGMPVSADMPQPVE